MTRETVDQLLAEYLQNKGRINHIEAQICEAERMLNVLRRDMTEALAGPKAQVITDMPHGTTVGNPTEALALRLVDDELGGDVDRLKEQLERMREELQTVSAKCMYVDGWLEGLTERDRYLVEKQVIQHEFWRDIENEYAARFGERMDRQTLKRLRTKAVQNVYKMACVRI